MALIKLVPDQTKIPFTSWRMIAIAISGALVLGAIGAVFALGFNFGVDFRGGVTVEVSDNEPIDLGAVRSAVNDLGLGGVRVQEIQDFAGAEPAVVVFVPRQVVEDPAEAETAQQAASQSVQETLRTLLGDGMDIRKVDVVGPTVSGELIRTGVMAVTLAIGLMLVYIWFRFEWQFSVGAILALVHDVVITLGMFAVTRLEFNLAIIAAILTIVGYSMNDTVVVYDRVRENLRKFKKLSLSELLDLSINETLSRTVMTSLTTLIALGALFILGGDVLRGFTFAMIWGVLIGTYSSIFVASPLLLATGVKRDWSGVGAGAPAPTGPSGQAA